MEAYCDSTHPDIHRDPISSGEDRTIERTGLQSQVVLGLLDERSVSAIVT